MSGLKGKYDAWNRLVEVRNASDVLIAVYEYNGLNQRIKKTLGGVETRSFFNENWQELESITSGQTTSYIWGVRYVDDLVLREKGTERLYSLADPNWNVIALCNSNGTVVERLKYDAFGKVSWMNANFVTKTSSDYNWNRTFTGQVLDAETNMMLYRNRFYSTGLGRFVTRDPIGYQAGDNSLYRYVFNKITLEVDSFGEQWEGTFGTHGDYYEQQVHTLPSIVIAINPPSGRRQKVGKKFEVNGCTMVPDTVVDVSFTPACNAHDMCYETCGASKDDCDKQFYIDMYNLCALHASANQVKYCQNRAGLYLWGVQNFASGAYKSSQDEWCETCP